MLAKPPLQPRAVSALPPGSPGHAGHHLLDASRLLEGAALKRQSPRTEGKKQIGALGFLWGWSSPSELPEGGLADSTWKSYWEKVLGAGLHPQMARGSCGMAEAGEFDGVRKLSVGWVFWL